MIQCNVRAILVRRNLEAALRQDSIGIFQGGKTPLIMRARATGVETWKILGDGYIHGIMNGEVWDETKCEEIRFD